MVVNGLGNFREKEAALLVGPRDYALPLGNTIYRSFNTFLPKGFTGIKVGPFLDTEFHLLRISFQF